MKQFIKIGLVAMLAVSVGSVGLSAWCEECHDDTNDCLHLPNSDPWNYCGSYETVPSCLLYEYRYEDCFTWPPMTDKVVRSTNLLGYVCMPGGPCY